MLTIRLSRVGRKNKPQYRFIVSEKTKDPYGRALEILGSYDPYTKKINVKTDRVKHWLKNGSGMSDTVNNLLIENKIIEGKKVKATKISKKRKTKLEKKNKTKQNKKNNEDNKTQESAKKIKEKENDEEKTVETEENQENAEKSVETKENQENTEIAL